MSKPSEQSSREMVAKVREEVKRREKAIMQRLMAEERELWLDENPEDKGNGFYERSLLTTSGLIEDLRVPRTRSGEFYPAILPGRRRASQDLGDLVLIMFECGMSTRKIQQVIEYIYGTFYSHASLAKLARVAEEETEALKDAYLEGQVFLPAHRRLLPILEEGILQERARLHGPGHRPRGNAGDRGLSGHGIGGGERPCLAGDL